MLGHIDEGRIYIFYGKMGSGKTTNAMREVLHFRKRGKPVWVNFPVMRLPKLPKKVEDAGVWFEEDPAGILYMREGLFVIDEAYMTLNSREWQNLPKAVFTAFTHVRKLGMTVIVIAQSWMRIDKSIREVASVAREFSGASVFGRVYNFVDYEIDETGDIIKAEKKEYASAMHGLSLVRRQVYDAFDTDYLFSSKPQTKAWPTAIRSDDGVEATQSPVSLPPRVAP